MAKDPVQIWFVTWPDGKVFEGTQTSVSESTAVCSAIRSFLPEQWFPAVDLGSSYSGVGYHLWPSMKEAGFRCQSIEINAPGVSR